MPDRRTPAFTVPSWVDLPAFLTPHLAARNAVTIAELPYRIEHALHFSNGGGVYAARDLRAEERVVLKEARPHAGLTMDGADAAARLERERDILTRLAGLEVVPAIRDYLTVGDHRFVVMDFIEGTPLNSFFARKHPMLDPEPDPAKVADYTDWALRICHAAERAISALHERGVVFNDLHMFNIMVRPDESVALVDFEVATHLDAPERPLIGSPAFVAPRDRVGVAVDAYALACLRLAVFLPMMTVLVTLDRDKAVQFAEIIAEYFPVPRGFLAEALSSSADPDVTR